MTNRLITTIDNPYNPFRNMDGWLSYDLRMHNTPAVLARIALTTSEYDGDDVLEEACERLASSSAIHVYLTSDEIDELIDRGVERDLGG